MNFKTSLFALVLVSSAACSEAPMGPSLDASPEEAAPQVQTKAQSAAAVPVRVGTDGPEFDACASYGQVSGLNPRGDNYLSVRSGPDVQAEERDRLSEGTGLFMCDHSNGWIGVVYNAPDDEVTDCGAGSPVATPRAYDGPCRSGWVSGRFVELIAG